MVHPRRCGHGGGAGAGGVAGRRAGFGFGAAGGGAGVGGGGQDLWLGRRRCWRGGGRGVLHLSFPEADSQISSSSSCSAEPGVVCKRDACLSVAML